MLSALQVDRATTAGGRSARGDAASARGGQKAAAARLTDRADAPMDLLDVATSRQLVRTAAGKRKGGAEAMEDDFAREADGRMVIKEDDPFAYERKRKRGRGDGYDSDDSDFDDLRGIADLRHAMKSVAKSVRFAPGSAAAMSAGGKSAGGKSAGGRSVGASSADGRSEGGRSAAGRSAAAAAHSGERFKPKTKAAGGDTKGRSKVEPYAYWSFDRKMLNRRAGKKAAASASLATTAAMQQVAAKGAKAKRLQQSSKRQRTEA